MAVLEVNETNFKSEVLDYNGKVLVDFNAEWCGPCKMLAPVLEEIAEANNTIKFVSVNVDANERIAAEYNIMSIPTLLLFEAGELKEKIVGLRSKSELEDLLK